MQQQKEKNTDLMLNTFAQSYGPRNEVQVAKLRTCNRKVPASNFDPLT
jgi:hypothetical protein